MFKYLAVPPQEVLTSNQKQIPSPGRKLRKASGAMLVQASPRQGLELPVEVAAEVVVLRSALPVRELVVRFSPCKD
jgi:hypothetical protein